MSRAGEQQRTVGIGAGQAAAQLAISLRQGGFAGETAAHETDFEGAA